MEQERKYTQQDEIDLLALLQIVWSGKKTIIKFVLIFGLIGLFIAIFSAKEYTASTIVIPQISNKNSVGSLGGIAAMAGINIAAGGGAESISPMLYPKVVSSIPFRRNLIRTKLNIKGISESVTYQEYYEKHYSPGVLSNVKKYTIGLPILIIAAIKGKNKEYKSITTENDSIYRVSLQENILFKKLSSQLTVSPNKEEGTVKISFSMSDPLASAQMVKKAQKLLQDQIINLKIQKIKGELNFVQGRYNEVKKDYLKKQTILANFKDRNKSLINSRSQTRLERLESEYNLSYNLYLELAKKLESQKIKLKENTPIFTVIDPVSVPIEKSKPKRLIILTIWVFLGAIISILIILFRSFIKKLK